jgi:hypothetical protein
LGCSFVEAGRQTDLVGFAYPARVHPNPFSSKLRTSPHSVRQPLRKIGNERRCGREIPLTDAVSRNQLRLRIERNKGVLIAESAGIVESRHVALLFADVGPNLIDLDAAAGQLAHPFVHQVRAALTSTNKGQIVSRCVPVIRSVLRTELPSTKQ